MNLAKPLELTVCQRDWLQHLEQRLTKTGLVAPHLTVVMDPHLVSHDRAHDHDTQGDTRGYQESASVHSVSRATARASKVLNGPHRCGDVMDEKL
jgi:hypothetical protein